MWTQTGKHSSPSAPTYGISSTRQQCRCQCKWQVRWRGRCHWILLGFIALFARPVTGTYSNNSTSHTYDMAKHYLLLSYKYYSTQTTCYINQSINQSINLSINRSINQCQWHNETKRRATNWQTARINRLHSQKCHRSICSMFTCFIIVAVVTVFL